MDLAKEEEEEGRKERFAKRRFPRQREANPAMRRITDPGIYRLIDKGGFLA